MSTTVSSTPEALAILGLTAGANAAQVRRAFRHRALAVHPDRPGGTVAAFQDLLAACQWMERLTPVVEALDQTPKTDRTIRPATPSDLVWIEPRHCLQGGQIEVQRPDGGPIILTLPPGLRNGDAIRVWGQTLTIAVRSSGRERVLGNHLWIEIWVDRRTLLMGGAVQIETWAGDRTIEVPAGSPDRRVLRLEGGGLPARGPHPQGHLVLILKSAQPADMSAPLRQKLKRFATAWAA